MIGRSLSACALMAALRGTVGDASPSAMIRRTHRPFLLAAALAMVAAGAVAGAQAPPSQQAADLARQLMSPFCPGKLLSDCTSSQAYELRDVITARLEAGETVEAVRADLVRQYGAAMLGAPDATGFGLLAWVVPALIGLATAAGIGLKVARATRATLEGQAVPAAAAAGLDAGALSRLDEELRDLE
jgi:cytochrome c-type biogenesis protein CcmH